MMSSDPSSGDIIQKSLTELNQLRHEASKVFQTAAEGVKDISGEEGKEKKFLSSLKQQIDTVTSALGSVENNLSQPNSLPTALLLGSLPFFLILTLTSRCVSLLSTTFSTIQIRSFINLVSTFLLIIIN